MSVVLTDFDLVTAYGDGLDACWAGLLARRPAFSEVRRFDPRAFPCRTAGLVARLDPAREESLALQLLGPLLDRIRPAVPADAALLVASTVGEIDLLERHVLHGRGDARDSRLSVLAERVRARLGLAAPPIVVSAACASSSAAVAHAARLIRGGSHSAALVVAADSVTEFVFAGFSSLMALDPAGARPFDRDRKGLTVGEGAACALLMDDRRARREGRPADIEVAGWGLTNDANHMTGPSRDGRGLALAVRKALDAASLPPAQVESIGAHGTGTSYNDSMEMKAFRQVFPAPVPTYSIKGGTGHTMGAAGLVELLVALQSLRAGLTPPTVGLTAVDDEARGWAAPEAVPGPGMRVALSTNSGFGGVNCALVLRRRDS